LLAIQDEIYDWGYQREFWAFATTSEHGERVAQFPIYVAPDAHWNVVCCWEGKVIYKYPPFGEVARTFLLGKEEGGLVALGGSPLTGFPWTQPNTRTLYLIDDEVCGYKQTWRKVPFSLDLEPTAQRLKDAATRQKQRVGSSRQHR
jgi:hypothetical protein